MSLTTELLTVLENSYEPLQKRLRIANKAFISNDLLALNKESVILEWISRTGSSEDSIEVWKVLNSCLSDEHIQTLRPNDIKIDVLVYITITITKKLETEQDAEFKKEILHCATLILKNQIFQHYFKHDTKLFCSFIGTFLLNINDINEVNEIIKQYSLFNRHKIIDSNYSNNFWCYIFMPLLDVLLKFENKELFDKCLKQIQYVLFGTNKNFIKYIQSIFDDKINQEDNNNLVENLEKIYETDTQSACLAFKIIFVAFIDSYRSDTLNIYQFIVLILRIIGFEIDEFMNISLPNKINYNPFVSLNILAEIIEEISKENILISESINNKTFSEFLNSLLISVIRLYSKQTSSVLKIIKSIIIIDPVIITKSISEILMYLIHAKDENAEIYYSQLMIALFEMYSKLHRLHKFCSEFLKSIHDGIFAKTILKVPSFKFIGKSKNNEIEYASVREIFPENVVNYFQECITLQTNKQIISIMRTFITNLNDISDNLNDYTEDEKILYVEIVSDLTCQFLSAVRIAEHTTTEITINKFFKDLDDLKQFLKKFGTALLKMEHNQSLMFSFLNLCYVWGENVILLSYYMPMDNSLLKLHTTADNSANNLTYLHKYLSTSQWSLVSQRIKNFGELPCKRILQKLIIQKLRAMLLFEPEINESLETSIISSYTSNLETCWDIIFTERFITSKFFIRMENSQLISLADLLITDILSKKNFQLLTNKSIIDSRDMVQSILYASLTKINSLFKRKRRHSESTIIKPLNTKILEQINSDVFIRNEAINLEKLYELFNDDYNETHSFKFDEIRFYNLMEIIKNIPVCSLSHDIQITLFVYLLSLCVDLKHSSNTEYNKCNELCETYLIALVENTTSPNILNVTKSDILMRCIIDNTQKYKDILNNCINKTLKQNDTIINFKRCLSILLKHISDSKYLDIVLLSFHAINKATKYKITEKNKEILRKYKHKLCQSLFDVVLNKVDNIEAYVLVFQKYLIKDNEDECKLEQILSVLNKYIDYTVKNIDENNAKGCLLLYELILVNKASIKNIPTDFNLSVWNACKVLKKNEDYSSNYDKTLILLFEHASVEQFPIILNDLFQSSTIYLKTNELDKISNQFEIWRNLLNSSLNYSKLKLFHDSLKSMLEEIMLYMSINSTLPDFYPEFVKLQINIIENKQISQSSSIIDIYFQTSHIIMNKQNPVEFTNMFDASFSILESFFKHRRILLVDRLPAYLVQLRHCIHHLCKNSDSDKNLKRPEVLKIANCAFRVEQLIKNICSLKKDMSRLAPYLVADILKRYEKITFYPEVKNHFNNCLNYLIDLCDSYAVSYLLRVLSAASREIFKNMHENYKKYYKFTGKV